MFPRRIRHARTQRAVRTPLIVMSRPLSQNRTQMCFRHRNYPIEAFSSYCPDHAFADRVRLRTRDRRPQHFDTQRPDRVIKVLGEDLVSVMDKILMSASLPDA